MAEKTKVVLGRRFEEALRYAADMYGDDVRKKTTIPSFSHPLAVASFVMEDGGSEDEAIAALLHDAAEDYGGKKRLDDIEKLFGKRVRKIVKRCSDTVKSPKEPWREHKERHLDKLRKLDDPGTSRVSYADKLANLRSIRTDFGAADLWDRFKGGYGGTCSYYKQMRAALKQPSRHADEVDELIAWLHGAEVVDPEREQRAHAILTRYDPQQVGVDAEVFYKPDAAELAFRLKGLGSEAAQVAIRDWSEKWYGTEPARPIVDELLSLA